MFFPIGVEPLATITGAFRLVVRFVVVEVLLFLLGFLLKEVVITFFALLVEVVAFLTALAAELVAVAALLAFLFLAEVLFFAEVFPFAFLAFGLLFGYLHHDTARVVVRVSEAFQNQRHEAFFHVDIGEVGIKVDAANRDVLAAGDVIDFADNLLRQDVVVLAHAEVKALHGLVLTVAFLLAFLAVFLLVALVGVEIDGVLVVVEETVEIECHHAGNEFLAAHPFQLAVDVDMLDAVDVVEELLLTYLLTRGNHSPLEGTAHNLFNPLDFTLFAQVDEADADTALVGTTRTTAAVHVSLDVVGQVVIDDVGQLLHVDATGGHIGSHQKLQTAFAEVIHDIVAHALR